MGRLSALVVAAALAGACTGSATTPSQTPPFSQTDLKVGTGATAASGNTLTVDYTGWLYDPSRADFKGLQFDTTVSGTPFQFTLGSNQVIQGWEQGVPGMKEGGVRRLIVPPSLAYGGERSGKIPPNATLVFEIQLVSVQ
jgi:FKBP-type peptidyl-prolyl cis-trans isomerase FkpA